MKVKLSAVYLEDQVNWLMLAGEPSLNHAIELVFSRHGVGKVGERVAYRTEIKELRRQRQQSKSAEPVLLTGSRK